MLYYKVMDEAWLILHGAVVTESSGEQQKEMLHQGAICHFVWIITQGKKSHEMKRDVELC